MKPVMNKLFVLIVMLIFSVQAIHAQFLKENIQWTKDGNGYFSKEDNAIVSTDIKTGVRRTVISSTQLIAPDSILPLNIESFKFSDDNTEALLFTNSAKVWRYHTRG